MLAVVRYLFLLNVFIKNATAKSVMSILLFTNKGLEKKLF